HEARPPPYGYDRSRREHEQAEIKQEESRVSDKAQGESKSETEAELVDHDKYEVEIMVESVEYEKPHSFNKEVMSEANGVEDEKGQEEVTFEVLNVEEEATSQQTIDAKSEVMVKVEEDHEWDACAVKERVPEFWMFYDESLRTRTFSKGAGMMQTWVSSPDDKKPRPTHARSLYSRPLYGRPSAHRFCLMRSCIDLLGLSSATMVHAYANSSIQACPCYALTPHAPQAHAVSSCVYLCERASSSRAYPLLCTRHPSTTSCLRGLVPLLMCLSASHTSSYPPLGPCVSFSLLGSSWLLALLVAGARNPLPYQHARAQVACPQWQRAGHDLPSKKPSLGDLFELNLISFNYRIRRS
ncbi:Unknown protein, partial [Striga hermonthica]